MNHTEYTVCNTCTHEVVVVLTHTQRRGIGLLSVSYLESDTNVGINLAEFVLFNVRLGKCAPHFEHQRQIIQYLFCLTQQQSTEC